MNMFVMSVREAMSKYPKQCDFVLKKYGYFKDENRWLVQSDEWLEYEGASIDTSYCGSDEIWLRHADLLMCALYTFLEQNHGYYDLTALEFAEDKLDWILKRINTEEKK